MSGGGSVTPMSKIGHREDEGSSGPVSLTSGPSKVLEQIMVSRISRPGQDN